MIDNKTLIEGAATEHDRHFVTSLARGLDVLRAFRPGEGPIGNNEIANRTGLPKSTVSRLVSTLLQLGYLTYRKGLGKYEPSPAVLSLGYTYLANNKLRLLSRPLMSDLAKQIGLGVAMGARDKLKILYIETARGGEESTIRLETGSLLPIATTAIGRAFLCKLPDIEREFLLEHVKIRYELDWPEIKKGVESAQKDYADNGFCLSMGAWQSSFHAIGAAALDSVTGDIASYNCGGFSYSVTEEYLRETVGPRLVGLARSVEVMCGLR